MYKELRAEEMNDITVTTEIKEQLAIKQKVIDTTIINSFGCDNCEWRYSDRCEVYSKDKENSIYPGTPCEQRLIWLFAYMPNYSVAPSHDKFMQDFGKSSNLRMLLWDNKELDEENLKKAKFLEDWKDVPNDSKLSDPRYNIPLALITREIKRLRGQWQEAMAQHLKYTDNQITRDTAKKIDLTVTNGLDRLRGLVIDAEVVDDDKKTNN